MLRIAGGRVYDPANGVAGERRDVCVQDGKIVEDVPTYAVYYDTEKLWPAESLERLRALKSE